MATGATGRRTTSSLCGGQYVTRLARYFQIGAAALGTLTIVTPGMSLLDEDKLIELGILQPGIQEGILLWTPEVTAGQQPLHRGRLRGPPVPPPADIPDPDQPEDRGRGRERRRGHGRGEILDDIVQRLGRMEVAQGRMEQRFDQFARQTSHQSEYQHQLLQQLLQAQSIPYQPFIPLHFGGDAGPSRQHGQDDSDDD